MLLIEAQTAEIMGQLEMISKTLLDYFAENGKRSDYHDLPFFKNILLMIPLKEQGLLVTDEA